MDTRPVIVHTCQLQLIQLKYTQLQWRGVYVTDTNNKVTYRALPDRCSCRQTATLFEANELIDNGSAFKVFKKKALMEVDKYRVWMPQQARVARVDMISKADIERAYLSDTSQAKEHIEYIEDIHMMIMENRAKLIVPFKPDPTDGRLLFPFSKDERTPGGHSGK